jgi:2-polyprenyl-3-methyl-5-hydroxy-6-metoxy-1,4-benzoquinol methylase
VRYLACPWKLILDQVADYERILDVGTGHGLFLQLARRRYPALQGVGIDHDHTKIAAAGKAVPQAGLTFYHTDQFDALVPGTFDCVTFIDVLYSMPKQDWPAMLKQARNFLKPGGVLIIKETVDKPRWKYAVCMAQETLALKILRYTKGASPLIASAGTYLDMLIAAEFTLKQHSRADVGYPWSHYLFIAEKP